MREETKSEEPAKSGPVMSYVRGEIRVAIFENVNKSKSGNGAFKTRNISITRTYQNSNGEWKRAHSIPIGSVPKLVAILSRIEQEQVSVENIRGGG